jgi:endogenous inhibitor of DNA gyrase (YacG/DUF329 family)
VKQEIAMAEKFKKVVCPTCGKDVEWRSENAFRPFCSERCKLLDLGAWANESYKVASEHDELIEDPDRPA